MGYIEYQLGASAFFLAMSVGADSRRTKAIGTPLTIQSDQFKVTNVRLDNASLRNSEATQYAVNWTDAVGPKFDLVPGRVIQIVQNTTVTLRQITTGADGSTILGVPADFPFAIVLLVDATVSNPFTNSSNAPLLISLSHIEGTFPNDATKSALASLADLIFPLTSVGLPLGAFFSSPNVILANAGVSTDANQTRIAIRLEPGNTSETTVPEWKSFYAGDLLDALNSNVNGPAGQWAVFVTFPLVEAFVSQQLEASLDAHRDRFRINGGATVQWFPFGGSTPSRRFSFNGDAINACPGVNTDINYDIKGTVDIFVSQPGTLQSRANVDWSGNFFELAACELAVVLFSSLVGVAILGSFGALGGFGVGFIGALVAATVYKPDLASDKCTQPSKHELDCNSSATYAFNFGGKQNLLLVGEAVAVDPGMVLLGSFPLLLQTRGASVSAAVKDFEWAPPVLACGSLTLEAIDNARRNIRAAAVAIAAIDVENTGDGRLVVNSVERLSADPLNVFPPENVSLSDFGSSWSVQVVAVYDANYAAAPYPLRLLLTTNGGLQEVVIPAIPDLSDVVVSQLLASLDSNIGGCFEAVDGFWNAVGQFNPEWLVDPPPEGVFANQSWQVQVIGLVPGETINFVQEVLGQQTDLAVGLADAAGVARLTALVAGGNNALPVSLIRADSQNGAPRRQDQLIIARQAEVVAQTSIPLSSRGVGIGSKSIGPRPGVFVLDSHGEIAGFDVSDPNRPIPMFATPVPGARGILLLDQGVLAWGREGLVLRPYDGSGSGAQLSLGTCCCGPTRHCHDYELPREVVGAVRAGTRIYVLQGGSLIALDSRSLTVIGKRECAVRGPNGIALTKDALVVSNEDGLSLFSLHHRSLEPVGHIDHDGISAIESHPVQMPRTAVFVSQ